jgi:two-component system response regulator NreC
LRLSLNDVIITWLPAADKQPWNIMKTSFMRAVEEQRSASPDAAPRPTLSLILIDDHAILRDGLRALFSDESDVELIGEAATVADGIALARRLRPDVVITDISFPVGSGLEAIGELRRGCESATIIVLTVHNTAECLRAAMRAGANEFVAKQAPFEVLLRAIRLASPQSGHAARPLPVSADTRGAVRISKHTAPIPELTPREQQVLVGVAQGYTSKQIAAKLERSVKTIVKHRSNMMRKLSLHDASAVTRYAIANGLLSS